MNEADDLKTAADTGCPRAEMRNEPLGYRSAGWSGRRPEPFLLQIASFCSHFFPSNVQCRL